MCRLLPPIMLSLQQSELLHTIFPRGSLTPPRHNFACDRPQVCLRGQIVLGPSPVSESGARKSLVDRWLLGGRPGIILVHDLTNKKSSQNLYRWSLEALNKDSSPTGVIVSNGDYDREQFAENPVPLLLIGTKFDQIPDNKRNEVLTRTAFLSEDFNAEEINLDCTNPRYLAAGTSNAVKLSRFFDKVIEKRYFTRDPSQMTGFTDRKRFNFKSLHYD
ncbi:hypothetical protein F2P81_021078 [Scophthalmus maximus]|uniref:Rab-like protein 3 n=1 Tax=Scophthalmus maximus TaxID=52904 RepID=A0A6A4S5B9_SCOMX|nr:hypothetical protein F2P81_021078 [Scophthalmus maximus]